MQSLHNLSYNRNSWERRRNSILAMLQVISERHKYLIAEEKRANVYLENFAEYYRNFTIDFLFQALSDFGSKHFQFFMDGFSKAPEAPGIKLVLDADEAANTRNAQTMLPLSANYVFGTILDQVANDLVVIQRASEQRIMSMRSVNPGQQPTIAHTLSIADQLAFSALQRIKDLLPDNSTVLTYFQKSQNVRVIPYAPVALIGIPVTCYGLSEEAGSGRDLLAIAHELGHHLYWNGQERNRFDQLTLRAQLRNSMRFGEKPPWLQNWLEEIFADVVSCWIGGPVTALSFQDLQSQARPDWMLADNGIHPPPALRPFIYSEALHQLGMTDAAQQLNSRWRAKLQHYQDTKDKLYPENELGFTPFHLPGQKKPEPVSDVMNMIRKSGVIEEIINILNPHAEIPLDMKAQVWVGGEVPAPDLSDEVDVEGLYDKFELWVRDTVATREHLIEFEKPTTPDADTFWADTIEKRGVQFDVLIDPKSNNREPIPENLLQALRDWESKHSSNEVEIPYSIWRRVLEFAGWSTEGPTDGNITGS